MVLSKEINFYRHRIRIQEINFVLDELRISDDTKILEIGCGSGVQSVIWTKKSDFVISSDIDLSQVKFRHVQLVRCSGEFLPFIDEFFDVVYSSCVLEHIMNRSLALREIKRALKTNGIFICIVPTFTWKVLQLLLYYPTMIYRFMTGKTVRKAKSRSEIEKRMHRSYFKYLVPSVHGEFNGNTEEARAYMTKNWIRLLESNGFNVFKVKKLLLYAPLGKLREKNITLVPPALKMEKISGLSSSIALFARPKRCNV